MASSHKAHHDDEGFDRIEIKVVPRYKESGLSGDEWRVSAVTRFYRKGVLVHETSTGRIRDAAAMLASLFLTVPGSLEAPLFHVDEKRCNQPGCEREPAVTYRLKSEFSDRGERIWPISAETRTVFRSFCKKHRQRGDCGLEDADANYEEAANGH